MFTGIVEELGTVVSREGPKLRIGATIVLADVEMGASIAVNGTCLTVVAWGEDWWEADVVDETYARTSFTASETVNIGPGSFEIGMCGSITGGNNVSGGSSGWVMVTNG